MSAIYKITNKLNGKFYIGRTNNPYKRWSQHRCPADARSAQLPIDIDIQKLGANNFTFEVIEDCSDEDAVKREKYWIEQTKACEVGYNREHSIGDRKGSKHPLAKLTEEDVLTIRTKQAKGARPCDVFKDYEGRVSFGCFRDVWYGKTWKHVVISGTGVGQNELL